ncbi:PilX N-terminal domain-containing pilus assembly protein [Litorivivens sp.]|uniref:pilus assembly PilX family protein n=1 Tax=Litorivivens sp. TaxID=2020868 RepID=UPI0035628FE0
MKSTRLRSIKQQRGAVLIVAMVLLTVLTLLAVSSMQVATRQEKIAGNTRDRILAFQSAEVALREAEAQLEQATLLDFSGSNGRFEVCPKEDTRAACDTPDWQDPKSPGWIVLNSKIEGTSRAPEYVIEKYPATDNTVGGLDSDRPKAPEETFRVTGRGFGSTTRSMVVLQTTYRRN